jgi:hypothetical protein
MRYWTHRNRHGVWAIAQTSDGTWRPFLNGEHLGAYGSPQLAFGDLIGGHTFPTSPPLDTSRVGLPDELSDWTAHSGQYRWRGDA